MKKRFLALLLAGMMVLTLAPAALADSVSGTFDGTAKGFGGDVTVSVTLTDGVITDVQAVGGWVKANIEGDLFLSEQLADLICVGGLFNVATFCQHVVNVSFH